MNKRDSGEPGAPRLLDQVRDAIRRRHYSYRTEQAYLQWIKRYPSGSTVGDIRVILARMR